jgi:ribose transport system ATP-binding protein
VHSAAQGPSKEVDTKNQFGFNSPKERRFVMSSTNTGGQSAGKRPTILLEAKAVSKRFSGVYAVKEVDFELKAGEIHALLGPNGSGKSTLIKMLDGVQSQDEGTIKVAGKPRSPSDVATVFQELSLIPALSVTQNIFLGNEIRNAFGLVDSKKMNSVAAELIEKLGLVLRPEELVENLSIAARQLVEITKAMHRNARVLVLDEPTSTLTTADQKLLFKSIRDIQKTGVGIIYVTHRLAEVFEIADRATVLRDGQRVLSAKISEIDMDSLVEVITGTESGTTSKSPQNINEKLSRVDTSLNSPQKLEILNLAGDRFSNVNLRVAPGQIVGIAGLTGTGRTELLETIAGLRPKTSGEVRIDGKYIAFKNVKEALQFGVALVPEDRHNAGVVLEHSILRNLTMAHSKSLTRGPFLDVSAAKNLVGGLIDKLQIKTASMLSVVQSLSGGNQQKVVFAKWMQPDVKVLLLDEPTQGVDVGARQEIYRVIHRFAEEGAGVLVASSDFVELQELCDVICFMTSTSMSAPEGVTSKITEQYIHSKLSERVATNHE